jgi:alpha-methylacyl-CoA racemase
MQTTIADGALGGIRVLDLTRYPPGGYCTVMLSDLGADVCRIEAPGPRPPMGSIGLNRGKRSRGLDLRHRRGFEVLRRLASWADVLVENERPGSMDERGFGYTDAAREIPSLIWCSISGYGQEGPYAQWSGHDLSYAAHSGLLFAVNPGLPWHPESMIAIPAGALMAVIGILAALRERDRTGTGCQLDISISESATWQLAATDGEINGDHRSIPAGPDRRLYECADGG